METLENDPLYQLLFSIKDQPWVFLGQKSIWALDHYITGYLNACAAFDPECFTIRWHDTFYHYVCDVYHIYKKDYTVFGIIRERGYGDADGLQVYFELLENFAKEKYNVKSTEKPQPLQNGEVRAFRLDRSGMADFAGKYIKEHSEELFGIPDPGDDGAYVFDLSLDDTLTCRVYGDRSYTKATEHLSQTEQLPVFSVNELIRYTVLFPKEAEGESRSE